MSCGCRPVADVRAEDEPEVTSVSRKRGQLKGARTDGGRVFDALFLNTITFSFLKQQQYIVLVTPPLWCQMKGAVLAVERATIS